MSRSLIALLLLTGTALPAESVVSNSPVAPRNPLSEISVSTEGRRLAPMGDKPVNLPYDSKDIAFAFGKSPTDHPPRIRYQLEGSDHDWRQKAGEMRLGMRFYNAEGKLLNQSFFSAVGVSSGWNNTPELSTFTHRRELVDLPADTASFQLVMTSAGPPTSIGIYIVSDIEVSRISPDTQTMQRLLDTAAFLRRDREKIPGGAPDDWMRDGDQPEMAKLIEIGRPGLNDRVFCLLDDDPLAHSEWHMSKKFPIQVRPGERVLLQWNEMFNIGDANSYTVTYPQLMPGPYRFRVNELDLTGLPTREETSIGIVVTPPFWKNPWAWAAGLTAMGISLFFVIRYQAERKFRRKVAHLQQQHTIEQERLRIARDIHDDLGARLTQLSLMSGMAEKDALTDGDRSRFQDISILARDLVFAMYETVWTVSPQNDNLESLVSFVCQSTENLCKPAGIRCRIQASAETEPREVRSEVRHQVILAVKEAVHNAIKHSGASKIELQISFEPPALLVKVSDDGKGFELRKVKSGHGLMNIERRMETVGGSVRFESSAESGTRVQLSIPIP